MKAKGNWRDVLTAAFENQAAYDAGHELPHNIGVAVTGGGLCCIGPAADFEVLADHGLTHAFQGGIAVSGGGGSLGGYYSGRAHRTVDTFIELAERGLVRWNPWLQIYRLDIELLEKVLSQEFDQEQIVKHPGFFLVTAARADGTLRVLDAKDVRPHAARAVCASSAFWPACGGVRVGDEHLYDGICSGNSLPLEELLEAMREHGAKHRPKVLILQSRIHPKYRQLEWWMWPMFAYAMYAQWPSKFRENVSRVDSSFADTAAYLTAMQDVDHCRIAPTPGPQLMPWTTDTAFLKRIADERKVFMDGLLKEVRPVRHV